MHSATPEERAMVVNYLAKVHPARGGVSVPVGFGSETFKVAEPIASVGAVGSGKNDVLMMK